MVPCMRVLADPFVEAFGQILVRIFDRVLRFLGRQGKDVPTEIIPNSVFFLTTGRWRICLAVITRRHSASLRHSTIDQRGDHENAEHHHDKSIKGDGRNNGRPRRQNRQPHRVVQFGKLQQ